MRLQPMSDAEAGEASRARANKLLRQGWYDAYIRDAVEKLSNAGNDMIELGVVVKVPDGSERVFRDWLTANDRGAQKARNCCLAVGVLGAYENGLITAAQFAGHRVRVKVAVRKQRGWLDQNVIEDYSPAVAAS